MILKRRLKCLIGNYLKNYIKSWSWYFPIPGFFVFIINFNHFKNVGLNVGLYYTNVANVL